MQGLPLDRWGGNRIYIRRRHPQRSPYLLLGERFVMNDLELDQTEHVTLCEALDRVLNKGAVVLGEVTISVANVDLIYLGLQLVLTSIDTCDTMAAPAGNRCSGRLT